MFERERARERIKKGAQKLMCSLERERERESINNFILSMGGKMVFKIK